MKNAIIKFLGIDKIQEENQKLTALLHDAKKHIERLSRSVNDLEQTDWNEIARDNIDYNDIASSIDMYDLVEYIDNSDIAGHIDTEDVARSLDLSDIVEYIDYNQLQDQMTDAIDMDILAQTVSEKIADRDGMHQLISEEIENQGVGNSVSTDAVQSMIDTSIEQFADSLEVMVSAKLNYEK